jgi:DNA polymerase elongation subunit (family B)
MKELISQILLLLAEIGVIVVMLIIIVRERQKIKETEKKNKRPFKNSAVPKSEVLYLD